MVVAGGFYERWGKWGYMNYCVACALPYIAWPLLVPAAADKVRVDAAACGRDELPPVSRSRAHVTAQGVPWHARYVVKANAWIAIFSFIGNYWYARARAYRAARAAA